MLQKNKYSIIVFTRVRMGNIAFYSLEVHIWFVRLYWTSKKDFITNTTIILPGERKGHIVSKEYPGAFSRAEKVLSFEGYVSRGVYVLTVHYPACLFFIYCCFLFYWSIIVLDLVAQLVKICLQCRRPRFDPWDGNIPWRREWLPTSVFLPGKSHRQRSLVQGVTKSWTQPSN